MFPPRFYVTGHSFLGAACDDSVFQDAEYCRQKDITIFEDRLLVFGTGQQTLQEVNKQLLKQTETVKMPRTNSCCAKKLALP